MAKTYRPKDIIFTFANFVIDGFAPGTFITVTQETPSYSFTRGATGKVVRVRSPGSPGTIIISLLSTATINDGLTEVLNFDSSEANVDPDNPNLNKDNFYFPINIKSKEGTISVDASHCWIAGPPIISLSEEMPVYEWTFQAEKLSIFAGNIGDDGGLVARISKLIF